MSDRANVNEQPFWGQFGVHAAFMRFHQVHANRFS
jgi:hypothetical protein